VVSLFCYDHPALPEWLLESAGRAPDAAAAAPGPAQAAQDCRRCPCPQACACIALPWLASRLRPPAGACDLNAVRGEDSLVRAHLGRRAPLLWQAYPQHDGATAPSSRPLLDRVCLARARHLFQPALAWPDACGPNGSIGLERLAPGLAAGRCPTKAAWAALAHRRPGAQGCWRRTTCAARQLRPLRGRQESKRS
jgi:hypothetical protein